MNVDIQKLKALAEAAQQWSGEIGESRWYEAECFKQPYFSKPDASYIAAANPAAVLELIAEIERLEERNVYWIDQANTIARDRNAVRAEREQLSKALTAIRDNSSSTWVCEAAADALVDSRKEPRP